LLICVLLFSCSDNDYDGFGVLEVPIEQSTKNQETFDTKTRKDFAQLLSKAVYEHYEVRDFLKKEALKQFDNDYNVFYPFVKNEIISEGKTFRDILISYCEDEQELIQIEETLPLLNILIPDLAPFTSFNPIDWDLQDEEVVVMVTDDQNNILYGNGDSLFCLSPNEIPDFPILLVKDNKHLKIATNSLRSTGLSYEFVDDNFNREKTQKENGEISLRHSYYDKDVFDESLIAETDGIHYRYLDESLRKAYTEKVTGAIQRDYIYFGLSKSNPTNGPLNKNIREKMLRFKISSNAFNFMCNDPNRDPNFNQGISQEKNELTDAEIISKMWKSGTFDFCFDIIIGTAGGVKYQQMIFSVPPRQLFGLNKVHVERQNPTLFRHSKYTYTFDSGCLESKWVYFGDLPIVNNYLYPWDISSQSLDIEIQISELDREATYTEKIKTSHTFAGKGTFSSEVSAGNVPIKLGFELSTTDGEEREYTVTYKKESDKLGNLTLRYDDPIIVKSLSSFRYLNNMSNGTISLTIIPENIVQ
jgi:hypothetical protein